MQGGIFMDVLILSCGTGGGHHAAARAMKEALELRGHCATLLDPYSLVGKNLDQKVGNGYIELVQKAPRLFGFIYKLGDDYRRLPIHSPVYWVNQAMCSAMQSYLQEHPCDVVLMTHIFPAEILTYMKSQGISVPKTVFIATDYTCIPFTEEIQCDYYVTPSPRLNEEFIRRGISADKLIPAGIPVRSAFESELSREAALLKLRLDPSRRYLLLAGGSIGAGEICGAIQALSLYLHQHPNCSLITICGKNPELLSKLQQQYSPNNHMIFLATTDDMALYMRACDAFLSKPGGLSSTEAAVSGTLLIHISPIPGCETKNMAFFEACGMSIALGSNWDRLDSALQHMDDPQYLAEMRRQQRKHIPSHAALNICLLAESICEKRR